jgi:hypothetical protein
MTMIRVEAQLTSDELVKAVEQLDAPELEHFVARIIALQARRKAPSLSQTEAELLQGINRGVPADVQRRYGELIARRRAGQLEPEGHRELLQLTEQVEGIEARRAEQLAALARLRGIPLAQLVAELGIAPTARHD